jgi:putative membrane protein
MFRDAFHGFCMALADSVPGVSGGTVAFVMGFYDAFIGSIHDLFYGDMPKKKQALLYLIRLGMGWIIGMGLAVLILNALFEQHIYFISSLFIGFILGAVPVVCMEESESMYHFKEGFVYLLIGIALIVGITFLNAQLHPSAMDLSHFSLGLGIQLFLIGMVAISAMFLPGISGSTILLIFGTYMPMMHALKELMHFNMACLPAVLIFIVGILFGAVSVVRMVENGLKKHRPQMIYFILGMMIASLYAIQMGPTTLLVAQAPLSGSNFHMVACLLGIALIAGMQAFKMRQSA